MLKLCSGLIFALSLAAPTVPMNKPAPINEGPKIPTKKPTKKPAKKPASQPNDVRPGEYRGTLQSIRVARNGTITEMFFKIAGNTRTIIIKGCGAKSADHPLLNWAFQENRLVSVVTGQRQCFEAVTVSRR